MEQEMFLTRKEVAKILKISESGVLTAWKRGEIPGTLVMNKYRVSTRQLQEHIESTSLVNYKKPKCINDSAIERKRAERARKCLAK